MRRLPRSATNKRPFESIASECGPRNSLGPYLWRIARLAAGADGHQQFSLRAELEHGVALVLPLRELGELACCCRTRVGDPDVALLVDVHAVRPQDLSRAEAGDDLAARIELHHRVDVRADARIRAAAIAGPNVLAVDVDVNGADRSPLSSVGQHAEIANGLVRIRQVVDWRHLRVLGRPG
jgi:hypothetical protein